jgi:hypothetical protein
VQRRADLGAVQIEPEVELAHVAVVVAERVRVVFEEQVLQHAALGHEAEEVEVAAEEHVQAHLFVVVVGCCCCFGCWCVLCVGMAGGAKLGHSAKHTPPPQRPLNAAHLDVVAVLVDERRDLAADPLAALVNVDLVALVQQLDGGRQAGEAAADDGDAQLGRAL